ncbi:hypothetical protein DL239_15570 [Sedimentitalea sp. CY04]|uniref:DUF2946 domain-containing protein n=1 Tax=Parasedimentitalea denitrificans TaxID=2211118 RepID=A0ABX0WAE1_9RHOB|nr:hypothetical protein [Sedimentitalea sp. CY04]
MSPFGSSSHLKAQRSSCLNWLRALIGVCALTVQMLAPIAAHSANTGDWMEICGEDGPALMQVQLSDDEQAPCPKCDECKFCQLVVSTGNIPNPALNSYSLPVVTAISVQHEGNVEANPAQFWHENRGPPNLISHTNPSDGICRPSIDETLSKGGASWT